MNSRISAPLGPHDLSVEIRADEVHWLIEMQHNPNSSSSRCNTTPTAAPVRCCALAHLPTKPSFAIGDHTCTRSTWRACLICVQSLPTPQQFICHLQVVAYRPGMAEARSCRWATQRRARRQTASARRALHWKPCAAAVPGFAACARVRRAVRVRCSIAMEPVTISCGDFGTGGDGPYGDDRIVTSSDTILELAAAMWGYAAAEHLSVDVLPD